METNGVRADQHLWCVCQEKVFLFLFLSSVFRCQSAGQKLLDWERPHEKPCLSLLVFSNIGKHGTWMWSRFKSCNFLALSSAALCSITLTVGPQGESVSGDLGTLFTGLEPVESTHSGEAFNPCPQPAPVLLCLSTAPLSIWTCSISTAPCSWLPYR